MPGYLLSPQATEDLREIWRYGTATWGLVKAEQYGEQLFDILDFLAANPLAGQAVEHIRAGYRRHPSGSHLIFYRISTDMQVEVIRILHQSMDIDQQLGN